MSSITPLDMLTVTQAFQRKGEAGHVLDFSNRTFSEFFAAELDVDIYDQKYATNGNGKLKRLKSFLAIENDEVAARTLRALWQYREGLGPNNLTVTPLADGGSKLQALVQRLAVQGPTRTTPHPRPPTNAQLFAGLRQRVLDLASLDPQPRGFALEKFLKDMFDAFGLHARGGFRNTGEQIDGSFQAGPNTYLLEAKWQNGLTGASDLHAFHGKIDEKAAWARGLFVSVSGFSPDCFVGFGRGKKLICMDGRDLHDMLDRELPFVDVLSRKERHAAETGHPFTAVADLFF